MVVTLAVADFSLIGERFNWAMYSRLLGQMHLP